MNTKLDKVRKALFESEQRYQRLVDNIPDMVFTLNDVGEYVAVNNEFTGFLGYAAEEIQGTSFNELVHPDDKDKISLALRNILENKAVIRGLECRIVHKNGQINHVEINERGVYGQEGELLYIEGVAHDISGRRNTEEKIRRLKEFNETIFNTIRSGIAVVDAKTHNVISANRAFFKQVNLGEDQVLGRNYDELNKPFYQPDGSKQWLSILDDTLQQGETVEADYVRSLNGQGNRHIEVSTYPIKNDRNEITEIILIERDVTEKKHIEYELNRRVNELSILKEVSEAILQSTLNLDEIAHIVLVGVTAAQGLSFNRAFLLLLDDDEGILEGAMAIGPSDPEEAGRIWADLNRQNLSFSKLLTSYDDALLRGDIPVNRIVKKIRILVTNNKHILIRALMEGKAFNVRGGIVYGNAEEFPETIDDSLLSLLGVDTFAIVPLYSRNKKIGVILADNMIDRLPITDEDINSLRIFANYASSAIENSKLYRELEERVKDLQRANELIRQKQGELLEAERLSTIGRMAAVLAHEIRNPLVSIGGYARSIIKEIPASDPRREELSIIVSETMRLEELVKSVLEYAKFTKPQLKPLDVRFIINSVLELVKFELKSNKIKLVLQFDENLPPILADEDQLRQVLINLIFNAIQAMPDGGELKIATSPNNGYANIKVSDTGCGIPEEHLEKVFSPFFTTKSRGSGLGLHLVSQIIAGHGGNISVTSQPDQGTVFTINLPLSKGGTP